MTCGDIGGEALPPHRNPIQLPGEVTCSSDVRPGGHDELPCISKNARMIAGWYLMLDHDHFLCWRCTRPTDADLNTPTDQRSTPLVRANLAGRHFV